MSALDTTLNTIDVVAGEGGLVPTRALGHEFELELAGDAIRLPDGRRIYPPRLHSHVVEELACAPLDSARTPRSRSSCAGWRCRARKSQVARHALARRVGLGGRAWLL